MGKTSWLLTLLCLLAFSYFYNSAGANQMARYNQTRAIVNEGVLYSDAERPRSHDVIRWEGHVYSNKAPGVSVLAVGPYFALSRTFDLLFNKTALAENLVAHLVTILTVALPCALLAALFFQFLIWMGAPPPGAALGTLAVCLGTTYYPYASMFFGHSIAGAAAFAAFALVYRARVHRLKTGEEGWGIFAAALLISLSVIIEYPLGLAAIVLTLYLLMTWPTLKGLIQWAVGGGIGVALLGVYNWLCFGNPIALSYTNYADSEKNTFPDHAQGIGGVSWPRREVLEAILWEPERGVRYFAPILFFLFIPGMLYMLWRGRRFWREGLTCLLMVVVFLAFNAGYGNSIVYWGGANSAGPRHSIPMFPFAGLPVAFLISALPALFLLPALASITVALMVTAVMPQISMTYQHPLKQFIWPFFLEGRLSSHQTGMVGNRLITEDSVAYSLGGLMGLPGSWALLPLLLASALIVALLLRAFVRKGEMRRWTAGAAFAVISAWMVALIAVPLSTQAPLTAPEAGPGVWGEYRIGSGDCRSPAPYYARMDDLDVNYVKEELRPFPGPFCARWLTTLTVKDAGVYQFQIRGQKGRLIIDGEEIPMVQPDPRPPKLRGHAELSAGPHVVQIQTIIPGSHGTGGLDWLPPGASGRFQPIPPKALALTPANVAVLTPHKPGRR